MSVSILHREDRRHWLKAACLSECFLTAAAVIVFCMPRGPVLSGPSASAMDTDAASGNDSGSGPSGSVPTSLVPYHDCLPMEPGQWCFEKACPWCLLGMRKDQHGDLKAAGASFHAMLAWQMQQDNYVSDAQLAVPFAAMMRTALALCTSQTSLLQPGEATEKIICEHRLRGLQPPPPPQMFAHHMSPPGLSSPLASNAPGTIPPWRQESQPAPSAADAAHDDGSAAAAAEDEEGWSCEKKSKKKKKTQWWNDDWEAEWRAEPKIGNDVWRSRQVKVRGDGDEWHFITGSAMQTILTFYDRAKPGETKPQVKVENNGHTYDYRFEGACYLTQWNPVHPESRPREVRVLYAAA